MLLGWGETECSGDTVPFSEFQNILQLNFREKSGSCFSK